MDTLFLYFHICSKVSCTIVCGFYYGLNFLVEMKDKTIQPHSFIVLTYL